MRTNRDTIALVLLAAGESRRFGGNKLLAEMDGKPMYRHLVDEIAGLPEDTFCRRLVVSQYRQILDELSAMGYEAIENCRSSLGISYSIRLAMQALGGTGLYAAQAGAVCTAGEPEKAQDHACAAVCFAVCDQPWLRGSTVLKLVREWSASKKGLGCLSCGGRDGNPAVFAYSYEKELLALTRDVGGRAVIRRHMDDLYRCEIQDPQELEDIDFRKAVFDVSGNSGRE